MPASYPSPEEVDSAVKRALELHQRRARRNPQYALVSAARMEELVSGYPIRPEPFGVGWFTVGILDDETCYECRVHFIIIVPGHDLLRTKPLYELRQLPNPRKPPRWHFSRATNQWEIDPFNVYEENPTLFLLDFREDEHFPRVLAG